MIYPQLYAVTQHFDETAEPDVRAAVRREIAAADLQKRISPGQTVAVAVGSRGIRNLVDIVAETVAALKDLGLSPFLMPAMGSHGGATSDGQAAILSDLGLIEDTVGAPVRSGMDVVSVGHIGNGAEVFMARDAWEADHLVVVNRIKPHTAFRGEVESGLCKMLTVGCGKHQGALNMHKYDLGQSIVPAAELILSKMQVLFGLAILENAAEQTMRIRGTDSDNFVSTDRENLLIAKKLLPRIPTDDLDILIVDQMGKNISGAGMDPNVIGMWRRDGGPRTPDYRTLVMLDLTSQSHGNAVGIGMVDLTTKQVLEKVSLKATYTNALTTGIWSSVRLPIALDTDREVVETALSRIPVPDTVRLARVRNTLELETLWVSKAVAEDLKKRADLSIDPSPLTFQFDPNDRLRPF